MRILVVDDNLDAVETLSILLGLHGHEVQAAHDGLSALDVASTFRPIVALIDLGLPALDGYDVARRLRAMPDGHQPVLVALTGWGGEEVASKAREAGFDHHLVKPVRWEVLMGILGAVPG